MADAFIVTCEHGGNRIPAAYAPLFAEHAALLRTHRGFDPGALAMGRRLARALHAPLVSSVTSRLLIDLNRSIGHPRAFSEATRGASRAVREEIIARYYLPYRERTQALVAAAVAAGQRVVHLSSHSFTPVLDGQVRNADIGLLYNPARPGEAQLCRRWQAALGERAPACKVRRNYPYAGKGDGLTSYLRAAYPCTAYIGIELEINQKHALRPGPHWRALQMAVVDALQDALSGLASDFSHGTNARSLHDPLRQ